MPLLNGFGMGSVVIQIHLTQFIIILYVNKYPCSKFVGGTTSNKFVGMLHNV